jgi:DNA-binding NarL/FixJ family response regulator
MENMADIRVILADDHNKVRAGIRHLLEKTPGITVVAEASNGVEALELVDELTPDVLVLDMEMPRLDGRQVAQRLQQSKSPVHILALSAYNDRQYILSMLENGAAGYLTKDEVPETLVKAIQGVARGEEGWVSRRVAAEITSWKSSQLTKPPPITPSESDILNQLSERKTNREIADALGIDLQEVESQIDSLCEKFRVSSRFELIILAEREGFIKRRWGD